MSWSLGTIADAGGNMAGGLRSQLSGPAAPGYGGGSAWHPTIAWMLGFTIAGADRKFVWADAKISGDTVIVSSPEIAEPEFVRYAWADNPACNLYNTGGLPAVPFRSDMPEK